MVKAVVSYEGHLRLATVHVGAVTSARKAWVSIAETSDGFTRLVLVDRTSAKGLFLNDEEVRTLIEELQDHLEVKDPENARCSICGKANH